MSLKTIRIVFIILFSFSTLSSLENSFSRCEPSLLFPELFFLESPQCFSFAKANEVYLQGSKETDRYLNRFIDYDLVGIYLYRYLNYLRKSEMLPALMTFMVLNSMDVLAESVSEKESEFENILVSGVQQTLEKSGGRLIPLTDSTDPLTKGDLSDNFFSALSYIASYVLGKNTGYHMDQEVLSRSFRYLISNISRGVDWEDDVFMNRLFNSFVVMKNGELIRPFISIFFYYLTEKSDPPSYIHYSKLRNMGLTKDVRKKYTSDIYRNVRKIFASFYLSSIRKTGEIKFLNTLYIPNDPDRKKMCSYLEKRGNWLENMSQPDEYDISFNEAAKIAEQCPDSFSLPFYFNEKSVKVSMDSLWLADLGFALHYIITENIKGEEADLIISGALRSSLSKSSDMDDNSLARDILSYVLSTGNGIKTIKALYAKQLFRIEKKDESEMVNEATETILKVLF